MLPILPIEILHQITQDWGLMDILNIRAVCKQWRTDIPATCYRPRLTLLAHAVNKNQLEHTLHNFPKTLYNQLKLILHFIQCGNGRFVFEIVKLYPSLLECDLNPVDGWQGVLKKWTSVANVANTSHSDADSDSDVGFAEPEGSLTYSDMSHSDIDNDLGSIYDDEDDSSSIDTRHPPLDLLDPMRKVMDYLADFAFTTGRPEPCSCSFCQDYHGNLRKHADVVIDFLINKSPWRMCYLAAYYSRWDVAEPLLENSDVDVVAFDYCLYHYALRDGRLDLLQRFCTNIGWEAFVCDKVITQAAEKGYLDIVCFLLPLVDLNYDGMLNLLSVAKNNKHQAMVELLSLLAFVPVELEAPVQCNDPVVQRHDLNAQKDAETLKDRMIKAIQQEQYETLESINELKRIDFDDLYSLILTAIQCGNASILNLLFSHKKFRQKKKVVAVWDRNRIDHLLYQAANLGHIEIFKFLLHTLSSFYHDPSRHGFAQLHLFQRGFKQLARAAIAIWNRPFIENQPQRPCVKEMLDYCVSWEHFSINPFELEEFYWNELMRPDYADIIEKLLSQNPDLVIPLIRIAVKYNNTRFLSNLSEKDRERFGNCKNIDQEISVDVHSKGNFKLLDFWLSLGKQVPTCLAQCACHQAIRVNKPDVFEKVFRLYVEKLNVHSLLEAACEHDRLTMVKIMTSINSVVMLDKYFNVAVGKNHLSLAKYLASISTRQLTLYPIGVKNVSLSMLKWLFSVYGNAIPLAKGSVLGQVAVTENGARLNVQRGYFRKERLAKLDLFLSHRHPILLNELQNVDHVQSIISNENGWMMEYLARLAYAPVRETLMMGLLEKSRLFHPCLFFMSLCDASRDPAPILTSFKVDSMLNMINFIVHLNHPRLDVHFYSRVLMQVCALEKEPIDHVRLLLSLDSSKVDPSYNDNTPLKHAAKRGHLSIMKMLLRCNRVDPSAENQFALGIAAREGHRYIVEYLLSLNDPRIDPNVNDGEIISSIRLHCGHSNILDLLK